MRESTQHKIRRYKSSSSGLIEKPRAKKYVRLDAVALSLELNRINIGLNHKIPLYGRPWYIHVVTLHKKNLFSILMFKLLLHKCFFENEAIIDLDVKL